MANRPKRAYRATSDAGKTFGVEVTTRDIERLSALVRWYCLTAEHITRMEMPQETWNPGITGVLEGDPHPDFAKHLYAVKRRLAKLARVDDVGTHSGPLAQGVIVEPGRTGWYATPYGATAASSPWRIRPTINPQFASHAWMAADVGLQIESLGYTVLSERELASGIDKNAEEITTSIASQIIGTNGQSISKKPDLAVLSTDRRSFIAVEVEKWRDRPLSHYTEKLRAYDDNPAVKNVWYLCGSDTVANRVAAAAEKVFGDREFPLRIRVTAQTPTWKGVLGMESDGRLLSDLEGLR